MSKKTELINVLQNYRNQYTAIMQRINEARQSNAYTDQGRAELINKIVVDFQPVAQQHHDQAISIIDAALTALADKWKKASTGKLLDGGYQAGFPRL